jgi:hypothetical protein
MGMSEGPHVYRAMIAVKKKLSEFGLAKARNAPAAMGSFAFRGIDDLYNTLCGIEAEENLIVYPRISAERTEYQTNDKGKLQTHVHLTMELKFVSAVDGSFEMASAIGEGIDSGDKASGKAQSNAMKFAHLEVYKIPTEGLSDDVEAHAEQVGPRLVRTPGPPSTPVLSPAEKEIGELFAKAKTTTDVATAEALAAKAISEKKVVNGGRERLLKLRAEAIARVDGR